MLLAISPQAMVKVEIGSKLWGSPRPSAMTKVLLFTAGLENVDDEEPPLGAFDAVELPLFVVLPHPANKNVALVVKASTVNHGFFITNLPPLNS